MASVDQRESFSCRICLEEADRTDLIAPCHCRGSSKWVHRACLDQWRTMREDRAFSKCTECLAPYKIISRHIDSQKASRRRLVMYACEVARDALIAFSLAHLFVGILGLLTYALDSKNRILLNLFSSANHIYLFYYIFGAFLFFAVVGIFSIISLCTNRSSQEHLFNFCHRNDFFLCCHRPIYMDPNCGICCIETHCCTSCSEFNCLACATFEGSAECLPIFLIVLAVFAILGVFVAFFAGMAYLSRVTSRHLEIVQKKGLVGDFVVADLEAEEGDEVTMVYKANDIELGYAPVSIEPDRSSINPTDQRMLARLGLL